MNLREELTGRLEECYELGSNDGDRPNSADATEIIDKVLDAAVEAIEQSRKEMWKDAFAGNVQGGIETAIQAINNLRSEK